MDLQHQAIKPAQFVEEEPPAAETARGPRKRGIHDFDAREITVWEANGRECQALDPARDGELLDEIRRNHQKVPAVIRELEGKIQLIARVRRRRVALELLKDHPGQRLRAELVEASHVETWQIVHSKNSSRGALRPLEQARSWSFATGHVYRSQNQLAKALGKSDTTVSRTITPLEVPKELVDLLRNRSR